MNSTLVSLVGSIGITSVFVVFVTAFSNMTNHK